MKQKNKVLWTLLVLGLLGALVYVLEPQKQAKEESAQNSQQVLDCTNKVDQKEIAQIDQTSPNDCLFIGCSSFF